MSLGLLGRLHVVTARGDVPLAVLHNWMAIIDCKVTFQCSVVPSNGNNALPFLPDETCPPITVPVSSSKHLGTSFKKLLNGHLAKCYQQIAF